MNQRQVRIFLAITLMLAVLIGLVWFALNNLETEEPGGWFGLDAPEHRRVG